MYGAYRDEDGYAQRALFAIDPDGVIRWSYLSPVGVNPGADGLLDALESMSSNRDRDSAASSSTTRTAVSGSEEAHP
jgi:alkyl hydroperoxide reductase subunit AhpC